MMLPLISGLKNLCITLLSLRLLTSVAEHLWCEVHLSDFYTFSSFSHACKLNLISFRRKSQVMSVCQALEGLFHLMPVNWAENELAAEIFYFYNIGYEI